MTQPQKGRDPFSMQPLPKSFYFPSLHKHVDGSQAIHSSHSASSGVNGNTNSNNNVYSSTSVAEMKTLPYVYQVDSLKRKEDLAPTFDEVWPDSERPSSPSFADMTAQTEVTDSLVGDPSSINLQDAVRSLEGYDSHRYQQNSSQAEESTLQKYIERFRKSEPRPREERMKEMSRRKQEFWWLQPDVKQTENTKDLFPNKGEEPMKLENDKDLWGDSYQGVKLTKEALLAMDEATLHLQTKADMLLSKSELSLATSSGPMVSTDGLGTSCSLSDQSTLVDAPAYRPAFVNTKDIYKEAELSKTVMRGGKQFQQYESTKPDCGDILSRWRFRRKMEESHGQQQPRNFLEPVQNRSSKGSAMDARLEEFRKRLLSQRMLVTPVDIHYERQKMNMLLEEDEEQEPHPPKLLPAPAELPSDPVLERLQRITKTHDISRSDLTSAAPVSLPQNVALPPADSNARTPQANCTALDVNNSSVSSQLLSNPLLNKNNTALSNTISDDDFACDVDNISAGVQIIGDPKSRVFDLGQPQQVNVSAHTTPPAKVASIQGPKQVKSKPENFSTGSENQRSRSKRPLQDLPLNQLSNIFSVPRDHRNTKEDKATKEKPRIKPVQDEEKSSHIYHQFLQAEKPSSDLPSYTSTHHSEVIQHSKPGGQEGLSEIDRSIPSRKSSKNLDQEQGESLSQRSASPLPPNPSRKKVAPKSQKDKRDNVCSSDSEALSERSRNVMDTPAASITTMKGMKLGALARDVQRNDSPCTDDADNVSDIGKLHQSNQSENSEALKRGVTNKMYSPKKSKVRDNSDISKACLPTSTTDTTEKGNHSPQSTGERVQSAIGQSVRDHMFDGSLLLSSVDSWASAFPPSPVNAHRSLPIESSTKSSSPGHGSPSLQSTPQQCTPLTEIIDLSGEEMDSGEEYEEDPLLRLLRHQRAQYIQKLELIEQRLQELDSNNAGSRDD